MCPHALFSQAWSHLNFLHIWIKQLLNLLVVKFHTHSFFFLGDMDFPRRYG